MILISGDAIFKLSLYYFIFEMKYVYTKLQSRGIEEYLISKKYVKKSKALVMIGYGVI